jgi:hypothetical protein
MSQAEQFVKYVATVENNWGDEDMFHAAKMHGMCGHKLDVNYCIVQFNDQSRASWHWNPNGTLANIRALKPNRIFIATVQVALIAEDEAEATDNLARHLFIAEAQGKALDFRFIDHDPMTVKEMPATTYVEGSIWNSGLVIFQCCYENDDEAEAFGPRFVNQAEAAAYGRKNGDRSKAKYISVCAYQVRSGDTVEYLREMETI